LRHDVAFLKEEVQLIAMKKDMMVNDLTKEIHRLRELKRAVNEQDHKESVFKFNEPTRIDIRGFLGASVVSAPLRVKKDREHDIYLKQEEINRFKANTDTGIRWTKPEGSGFILDSGVLGSKRGKFEIPQIEGGFSQRLEEAAHSFLEHFCKLKPRVLSSLWMRYVEKNEGENGVVLNVMNLPILLDNLILYIFKNNNPYRSLPSRRKTKQLVSFLEFKLDPFIRKKKYITIEHFMQFPQWLRGRKFKSGISLTAKAKVAESMTSEEEIQRQQLNVGSACKIWSNGASKWCKGKVVTVKHDSHGDWLVVRYSANRQTLEKEIQRFSNMLDVSGKVRKGSTVEPHQFLEKYEV
jgi:NOL1/NOP2/fmu family ribosome biogenesis protein